MLSGGLALFGGMVAMSVYAYLKGKRVEGWAFLLRRLVNTLLGYGLLTLIVLGIRTLGQPSSSTIPPLAPVTPSAPEASRIPDPQPTTPTQVLRPPPLAYALTVAALLVGGGLLVVLRKTPTAEIEPPEPDEPELLARARRRLEVGDQVRDAIIACYAEMSDVFLRNTHGRASDLTAREFAASLRARGIQEPEILALTSLFEKARYSLEPCGEPDREHALKALCALEARYGTVSRGSEP
jgi:hypothetical protein